MSNCKQLIGFVSLGLTAFVVTDAIGGTAYLKNLATKLNVDTFYVYDQINCAEKKQKQTLVIKGGEKKSFSFCPDISGKGKVKIGRKDETPVEYFAIPNNGTVNR